MRPGARLPFKQEDIQLRGHSIECRPSTHKDPDLDFAPDKGGKIQASIPPGGPGTRMILTLFGLYRAAVL